MPNVIHDAWFGGGCPWPRHSRDGRPTPAARRIADPAQDALAGYVGARLARLRTERGWSQAELGRRLGVTRTAVGRWERGLRQMPLDRVVAAARVFGVGFDALLPDAAATAVGADPGED